MKEFAWDETKNRKLKKERGVSFEEILFHIERGGLLAVLNHPNFDRYKNQKILVVQIGPYAYAVPIIENESVIYLKTIFPSRKLTKLYIERKLP